MTAAYDFTAYPDGRLVCRLGHEIAPGDTDDHLHREPVDNSRAFGLGRLLDAVESLPPAHDCPGRLRRCVDHPGWRVFRTMYGGEWYSLPPGPETFPTPDEYVHDTWAAAHGRVRAEQLAAITHSEGADAPTTPDLETPDA